MVPRFRARRDAVPDSWSLKGNTTMAFSFRFRVRNEMRDLETDRARLARLGGAIDSIRREVAAELAGLTKRYQSISADAAFLDQAIDNGETDRSAGAGKLDDMTSTMIRYEQRVAELSRQLVSLDELQRSAESLLATENPVKDG